MWFAGGLAVVAAGIVLVVVAILERPTEPRERLAARRSRTVTVEELRRPGLRVTWRGYDRGQVEALLSRAARTIEEVERYGPGAEDLPLGDTAVGAAAGVPPSFLAYDLGDTGAFDDHGAVEPADRQIDVDDLVPGGDPAPGDGLVIDEEPPPGEPSPDEPTPGDPPTSGQELEQRGGDGAGRLDR